MRHFWLFLIIASFAVTGCKKYNLKQPAYLSFSWALVNMQNDSSTFSSGICYPTRILLNGVREEGSDVSIEQTLPSLEATFSGSSPYYVQVDAPMGIYKSLGLKMELDVTKEVPVSLAGTAYVQGTPVQFSIDWYKAIDLNFNAIEVFDFKKKKKYDLSLVLDCSKLLDGISQSDWNNAVVSMEPGGPTVKISEYANHDLFDIIEANISGAMRIERK